MRLPGLEQLLALGDGVLVRSQRDVRVAEAQRLALAELARGPDGADRAFDRERRLRRDRLGRPRGPLEQLAPSGAISDTIPISCARAGRQALVVAEQRQPHDLAERHDPRHVDRLERGRHAVGDVRVEERGVLGGDDELDLAEHVERAAAGHAVHRRDHRLPEVAALRADVVAGVVEHERRRCRSRRRRRSVVSSPSPPICSMRSMPVQNAFSPAPVSTTQRTSSWRRSPRHSACSSRCISELNALRRSGRLSVTHATPSRSS